MPIQLSGVLHNYQPFRDLWEVTYIPPSIRYSSQIAPRRLIPDPGGTTPTDWNRLITKECYETCANGGVYAFIPFNFGPSLLKDLWINARWVYDKIIESEKESSDRFKGHSNAIAQASPNHAIVPLMREDKLLHIEWSISEYKKHFGKEPEGMWLPETGVDEETLALLADHGIKYVILAPKQAKAFRKISDNGTWQDAGWEGRNIDSSRPYKVSFEKEKYKDKSMVVFFYDKDFSRNLGFPDPNSRWLYDSSENFLRYWLSAKGDFKHFAVDGETFGHHHKGKAHLLAGAVNLINTKPGDWQNAAFTNYGLYLEQNPLEYEAKIYENTAWSCNHNLVHWGEARLIERESNGQKQLEQVSCDCFGGSHEWRVPLKKAFDDLAERIDDIYFRHAPKYFKDPGTALLEYGEVISCHKTFHEWFQKHGRKNLSSKEKEEAYMLLEMEKFKTYMFTSCGWFWEGPWRAESFANFICANTAIRIAQYFKPKSTIEEGFKALLSSNLIFKDVHLKAYSQAERLNEKLLQEIRSTDFVLAA